MVGFGGYPSVPPVLAASLLKIPTVLHEQNAVMGRANRFLASRVTAIATGFAGVTDKDKALAIKTTCIGNPLRPAVIEAAKIPYPPLEPNGPLKLLVFGGSQGASIMAEVVPPAIAKLEPHLQMRLKITQQTREEDMPRVREIYARAQVSRRDRALLQRSAGADGGEPSGGVAVGGGDGGGIERDRPARHSGAAAACARPGPGRQCPGAGKGRRRHSPAAKGLHARPAGGGNRRVGRRFRPSDRDGGARQIDRRA